MNARSVAFVAVWLLASTALRTQMTLGEGVTISFASVAEGKGLLVDRDDFVERMSFFDRAARLKTDKDVSERQYLEFVGQNALEWNDAGKQKINSAFQGIQGTLEAMALPFPKKVRSDGGDVTGRCVTDLDPASPDVTAVTSSPAECPGSSAYLPWRNQATRHTRALYVRRGDSRNLYL